MNYRAIAGVMLLALNGCGSKPAPASEAANRTPESAARVYGEALRDGDYALAARLMHPSALRQWRGLFEPLLSGKVSGESAAQIFGLSEEAIPGAPDTVLFAAFLRNILAQQEGLGDAMKSATILPLGHVARGDTMLVVTRVTIAVEGVSMTQLDVMPFILDQGKWWALLKADLTNMAAMIQRAATQGS